MAIKRNRMKDVAFYSGFSYLREVHTGYFQSVANAWGWQEINANVLIPAVVRERPPYIEFYITHNSDPNTRYGFALGDQIRVGVTGDRIYCNGNIIPRINYTGNEPAFRIHYVIYGAQV